MRFPEWLYKLLPGDAGSQQLGVVWRENTITAALVTVGGTVYTVPSDKCLVLTNATLHFTPGAAQTSNRRRLMADPPDGTTRYNIWDAQGATAVATATAHDWVGEVVIPPGWKVRVEGEFSAGAAANISNAEIHGYLIPRGTFVFG